MRMYNDSAGSSGEGSGDYMVPTTPPFAARTPDGGSDGDDVSASLSTAFSVI